MWDFPWGEQEAIELEELGFQASFLNASLPLSYLRTIFSISSLCLHLLRSFSSPFISLSPPIMLQMRLCGLRGMMHCHQMPRISPLNCSTRTLWRDWVQVGQAPLTLLTTWKREEEGWVHVPGRFRLQMWAVPLDPETAIPSGQKSLEGARPEASGPCLLRSGLSLDLLTWTPPDSSCPLARNFPIHRQCLWGEAASILYWSGLDRTSSPEGWIYSSARVGGWYQLLW